MPNPTTHPTAPTTSTAAVSLAPTLPLSLQRLIDAELLSDERVVWQGQPSLRHRVKKSRLVFCISLPLLLFSILALVDVLARSGSVAIVFAALPLTVFGVVFASAPVFAAAQARGTAYALTNRRVLIIENVIDIRRGGVRHVNFERLDPTMVICKDKDADGVGSLVFKTVVETTDARDIVIETGFMDIADVARVEAIVLAEMAGTGSVTVAAPVSGL